MFGYYLKSLHNYHEQNMDLGNATSQAYVDVISSYLEGQYLLGKAMLHPGVRTLDQSKPDLESFWALRFDDEMHQCLILRWFGKHLEKNNEFNKRLLDAVQQHACGLNALTAELVSNLERDLPIEFSGNFDSFKTAVDSVTQAEIALVTAAEKNLKAQSVIALSSPKPALRRVTPQKNPASKVRSS